MNTVSPSGRDHRSVMAALGIHRLLTPPIAISAGALLLCLTGIFSLITPTDGALTAIFRLVLVAVGFALYGYGKAPKQREQNAEPGTSEIQFVRGLGGWLFFLGLVLAVTLGAAVIQAIADIPHILDGKVWAACTTPGQPDYDSGWATLLVLDWGSNLFVVLFFPILLSLFLQKRKSFRPLMVSTLGLFVLVSAFQLWQVNQVPQISAASQAAQFWVLIFAFGKAAIWIPYLLFSRHSKATFEF